MITPPSTVNKHIIYVVSNLTGIYFNFYYILKYYFTQLKNFSPYTSRNLTRQHNHVIWVLFIWSGVLLFFSSAVEYRRYAMWRQESSSQNSSRLVRQWSQPILLECLLHLFCSSLLSLTRKDLTGQWLKRTDLYWSTAGAWYRYIFWAACWKSYSPT